MLVHEPSKLAQVAGFQRAQAGVTEFLGVMQILQHALIALVGSLMLILENRSGATAIPSEEQDQVVLQVVARFLRDLRRSCLHAPVFMKMETSDASQRSDVRSEE